MTVSDVSVCFAERTVLEHASLTVERGKIITLIGPNGAGKTTLVRVVLGLLKPTQGDVWRRPGLRIGYMPQRLHIDASLPLSVERFLRLGLRSKAKASQAHIKKALKQVGAEGTLTLPMQTISGGEWQRVLLARALLREPDLLVLDEPVQGVDVGGQVALYELIAQIRSQIGCGILMVSHDLHLVMAATDTVVCLNHHVCCSGHPEAVTKDPAYLELFGEEAARLAVYTHRHDHAHDIMGAVKPASEDKREV